MINKYIKIGLIVGFILAIINTIAIGIPGELIWLPLLKLISIPCVSEFGCWWTLILTGDFYFLLITPLIFAFDAYIKDKEKFPTNANKRIIISIVFFIIIVSYLLAFL